MPAPRNTEAPAHYEDILHQWPDCPGCQAAQPIPYGCYVCRQTDRPSATWSAFHPGAWLCRECRSSVYAADPVRYQFDLESILALPDFDRFLQGAVPLGRQLREELENQAQGCHTCGNDKVDNSHRLTIAAGGYWLCPNCVYAMSLENIARAAGVPTN